MVVQYVDVEVLCCVATPRAIIPISKYVAMTTAAVAGLLCAITVTRAAVVYQEATVLHACNAKVCDVVHRRTTNVASSAPTVRHLLMYFVQRATQSLSVRSSVSTAGCALELHTVS